MPGILANVIQLALNFANSSIQAVHRALHVSYIILCLRNIVANTVNNRGIRLFLQQLISGFLIIIRSFQRLRQIANTVLQILYSLVIGGLVLGQLRLHRRNGGRNFAVYCLAVSSHPFSGRAGVDRDLFNFLTAIQESHFLRVIVKGYIKIGQAIQVIHLVFQRVKLCFLGIVRIQVGLQLLLDTGSSAGNLAVHICNSRLGLGGTLGSSLCLFGSFRNLLVHQLHKTGVPVVARLNHTIAGQGLQNIQLAIRAALPQIRFVLFVRTGSRDFKIDFTLNIGHVLVDQPVKVDLVHTVCNIYRRGNAVLVFLVDIMYLDQHLHQVNAIIVARHLKRDKLAVIFLCQVDLVVVHLDVFQLINGRVCTVLILVIPFIFVAAGEIVSNNGLHNRFRCHCFYFLKGGKHCRFGSFVRYCALKFLSGFFKGYCQFSFTSYFVSLSCVIIHSNVCLRFFPNLYGNSSVTGRSRSRIDNV